MVRLINKHIDKVSKLDFGNVGDEDTLEYLHEGISNLNEITFLIKTDIEYRLTDINNKNN